MARLFVFSNLQAIPFDMQCRVGEPEFLVWKHREMGSYGTARREMEAIPIAVRVASPLTCIWREFSPFNIANAHGITRGAKFKDVVRVNAAAQGVRIKVGIPRNKI